MKFFYTFSFCFLTLLMPFIACDTPNNFADNYEFGSYLAYKSVDAKTAAQETALFDYNDLASAALKVDFDIIGEPSKIEVRWIDRGTDLDDVVVKEIPTTASSVTITALDLAKAVSPSNSTGNDLQKYVDLGGQIRLSVVTYKGDIALETQSDLESGEAINNFKTLTISLVCPFVADDAVGTYVVEKDAWADLKVGDEVEVVKISDTRIAIVGFPKPTGSVKNSDTTFVKVTLSSGVAEIGNTLNYGSYGEGETLYSVREGGSGLVFSCTGVIDVKIDFASNTSGNISWPAQNLRIKKK